jgi:UDP-glucose 4-epimerase
MRALVTGAGGFVGANLVRRLLAGGHESIAVLRPGGNRWRLADLAGEVMEATIDLCDRDAVIRLVLDQRPDVIFHLAAHGAYSWQNDLDMMLSINVRAIESLLVAAREVQASLISAGSSSEYGYQDHPPREDERVKPNSHYAVTKVAATHLCQLAAATGNVRAITLRLYSIYGVWEEPGRLMPTLVQTCLKGCWPPLVGPQTARDFVWIEDACEAFLLAATADIEDGGSVFNVASGTQTTLQTLVAVAQKLFGVDSEPLWGTMPARTWDTSTWVGDPASASRGLGWKATTALDDGLTRIATWFGEHPELAARYTT